MDIQDIIKKPELLNNIDQEQLVLELIPLLDAAIVYNTSIVIPKITFGNNEVTKEAFKKMLIGTIKLGVNNYIKHKKWQTGIQLLPYLTSSLRNFSTSYIDEYNCTTAKSSFLVCPACRIRTCSDPLEEKDGLLHCKSCENKLEYLLNENINDEYSKKIKIHQAFVNHSKEGVKCNKCLRFVPISNKENNEIVCPFCDIACIDCKKAHHPKTFIHVNGVSLSTPVSEQKQKRKNQFWDVCSSNKNSFEDISNREDFINIYNTTKELINIQKKQMIKKIPIKETYYEAFLKVLEEYPEEMVRYLAVGGKSEDFCIQSVIFNNFSKLMKDKLPISFYKDGDLITINSLTDPKLQMYNAIREFNTFTDTYMNVKIQKQFIISNEQKLQDNDPPQFIGEIISIKNANKENITDHIKRHTFTTITLNKSNKINSGQGIVVRYYSILGSYSLDSLIYIQRVKKNLTDSLKKKKLI